MSHPTEEAGLSVTAERQAVTQAAGAAPDKDWVIVTRGLKREYDMGGEIVRALRGVDLAIREHRRSVARAAHLSQMQPRASPAHPRSRDR